MESNPHDCITNMTETKRHVVAVYGGAGDDEENRPPPGPTPDTVKIEGPWEQALRRAMKKKRPPDGWPKITESEEDKNGGENGSTG